jgi:hypothetical protein
MQRIEASPFTVAIQEGQSWPEWAELPDQT